MKGLPQTCLFIFQGCSTSATALSQESKKNHWLLVLEVTRGRIQKFRASRENDLALVKKNIAAIGECVAILSQQIPKT